MKNSRFRIAFLALVALLLGGCGGGDSSSSDSSGSPASTTTWSPPAPGEPPTPTPSGPAYYFSDCQDGAQSGCAAGDNTNPGTDPAAPKRDLTGFDPNQLPAGSQVLFARGGAWTNFSANLYNLNATGATPIYFDSYTPSWGGTARPWLRAHQYFAFRIGGQHQNAVVDGGYVIRNLRLDGSATSSITGLFIGNGTRNVFVENLDITGFGIAIQMTNDGAGNDGVTIRGNDVALNTRMGILGAANDLVIEGNTFRNNNFSGSAFNHAIYLGSGGHESRHAVVRSNTFTNNSVCTDLALCPTKVALTGACDGGNVTIHGQWNDALFESNRIEQVASTGGCYGFSITTGYDSAEWFRNFTVRGNTVINLGNCSVCANATTGLLVENNKFINNQTDFHAGVSISGSVGAGDEPTGSAVIRNNVACFPSSAPNQSLVHLIFNAVAETWGNLEYRGIDATTGACSP